VLIKLLSSGAVLMVVLAVGACATDNLAPPAESRADDPEGTECILKGYEFASELYRTCRNGLIEEHAKQRPSGTKGIY